MALPITIPNTFAGATSAIPLSQLDNNFSTVVNGINGIGNGTNSLANVSITGGNITTLTTALSVPNGGTNLTTITANNVILGNGTNSVQVVAPGTTGNLLTSNGTTWISSAPAAGNTPGWVYLSTVTASAAATADIETTFDSTYDNYAIVATGVTWSATSILGARFKISGSYATTGYSYSIAYSSSTTVTATANTGGTGTQVNLFPSLPTSNYYGFVFYVYSAADTATTKTVSFSGFGGAGGGTVQYQSSGGGGYASGAALTGVRFLMTTGNITGTFRLYGIKNS
jgi:hypothetical protein